MGSRSGIPHHGGFKRIVSSVTRAALLAFQPDDADEAGSKPSATPLLVLALGLWAGCACAYTAGEGIPGPICVATSIAALALAGAFSILFVRGIARTCMLAALGVALGVSLGAAASCALHNAHEAASGTDYGAWVFEAQSDARAGSYRSSVTARATSVPSGEVYRVEVSLPTNLDARILQGCVFSGNAKLKEPSDTQMIRTWRNGVEAVCSLSSCDILETAGPLAAMTSFRESAIDFLEQTGDDAGALAEALVCGYREPLRDTELYRSFKIVGLAHLVAVSGAHLSIVCAFFAALLGRLRCPRAASVVIQSAFVLAYLLLAAAPVSAIRASIMALAGLSSFFARRRRSSAAAIGLCIVSMIALAPETAVSASFFLSAASTLGIVMLSGLFESWFASIRLPHALGAALALTFSASVATTPYSAALFSQLPLISPLANIVAAPLFTLACVGGLFCTLLGLVLPPATPMALFAVHGTAQVLTLAVDSLAQVPYASVPVSLPELPTLVCSLVAAFALWALWPRPNAATLFVLAGTATAAALVAVLVVPRFAPDEIVMLDVGQGDAFLVRSRGAAVLIDTGNEDGLLLEGLARHGVFALDAVLVSHADDDHCASLPALRGAVRVGAVGIAEDAVRCPCASCKKLVSSAEATVGEENVVPLALGDGIACGNFALRVISPEHFADQGGNADSVCLLASLDSDGDARPDWTALFCGDAESEQLAALVQSGALGAVDVYKVGHHGSRAAITPELARAISPSISLVSVGENNRYGHPVASTLGALEQAGSRVFRTDEQGDVSCEFTATGVRVETLR